VIEKMNFYKLISLTSLRSLMVLALI